MAWPARKDIWGGLLPSAREDVARIARTIAQYEPVSLIARPEQAAEAASACGAGVEVVEIPNDDLWMRDIGPVFLVNGEGGLAGLQLNFNGWGKKQVHEHDSQVARLVLEHLGLPRFDAPFVSEGGALVVDGHGTVLATESSLLEPQRNPGRTREELTADILAYLGQEKMLWVPGLAGHDITDDHIDGLARFVGSSKVLVNQPFNPHAGDAWAKSERLAFSLLQADTNAQHKPLHPIPLTESNAIPPGQHRSSFANEYVNWYVCNGAVLIPAFDSPETDEIARQLIGSLYPSRAVEQLRIDTIAAGGGGIHCCTQQQPAVRRTGQGVQPGPTVTSEPVRSD
jgi:agmatine deiminase